MAIGAFDPGWHPGDVVASWRQRSTLGERAHRPWPVPDRPWVMGQTWERLLFAHWRVDAASMREVVPRQIALDEFDGTPWLAVTPFSVTGMHPRLTVPVPGLARFPEVNVRTYATIGERPGIYFFSLDTPNRLAVSLARLTFRLPYFHSRLDLSVEHDRVSVDLRRCDNAGPPATLGIDYGPTGPVYEAPEGTFERWAAERYCLYTLDDRGRVLRGEIHHSPWQLQRAEAELRINTMARPLGLRPVGEPTLHYAHRQDVIFWANEPAV